VNNSSKSSPNKLSQSTVAAVIVGVAVVISILLFVTKPEAEKAEAVLRVPLVETITVHQSNAPVRIEAFGSVQAHRELTLQAEVSGKVIEQSEDLDAGGVVKENEILLKIDPRNYMTAVDQEKANVEKAIFELKLEKGRQLIAEREWELLDPAIRTGDIGQELALRKPHVKEKEAALNAAKSKLAKAELDLARTIIRAPFNAIVLEEFVEIGQIISPQTKVATLISTDEFRIQLNVPYDQLSWIQFPEKQGEHGTPVTIRQDLGDGQVIERQGEILRLLGSLDPNGRMARVLVVINDPLGLTESITPAVPLLIGTYVQVEIEGPKLDNVFVIPREALREGDRVWVKNIEDKLEVRNVVIASRSKNAVVIREGLKDGDKVIISPIAIAVPGMKLRSAQ